MNNNRRALYFSVAGLLLSLYSLASNAASGNADLFNSFKIEGVSLGIDFETAISIAEAKGYTRTAPEAKALMKKEKDGTRKYLTIEPAISDTNYSQYRIVWSISYSKEFPPNVNLDPVVVMQDLKSKYGEPSKEYDNNRGSVMKSTMIYFRDANSTSNTAPQVRFETYKTSRKNRFNVTVHDTEIQEKNHASYFEEKTNKENAAEKSKPKAKIDF